MSISTNLDAGVSAQDLLAHSVWLQRLASRLVDPATAEDLVQETFATAVHSRPDRDRPLRPWLAEVLRNLARMRARRAGRWRTRAHQLGAAEPPLPTPEELLTFHEAQRLVAEAVAQLDEPYRSTVLLCYAQEIEPAEIARRQGIPGGTVRWRLKRGLDQVRAALDARYGQDRQRWRLLLAPLAANAGGAGAAAVTGTGVAGWAAGWKLATAGALLAAAAAVMWARSDRAPLANAVAADSERLETRARPISVPRLVLAPAQPAQPTPPGPAQPRPPGPGSPGGAPPPAVNGPGAAPADPQALRRALEPGDSPARGNPKAPVTIISYSEFQCPFCARVVPTLRELEAAYPDQIRLVWKHLPLAFHESAQLAAEAALAAGEQGKFWEMHDRLFANQDKLDPAALEQHAQALALDVPRFKAALDGAKYRARVESDLKLAREAGINGTPTFFINGEKLAGAQPLSAFKHQVEVALARLKGLPPPAPPEAARPPRDPARVMIGPGPMWPPLAITLPDNLLGDRIAVRFATGNAPVRGNPRGPVEVLYFTNLNHGEGRMLAEGLLRTHGQAVKLVAKIVPQQFGPKDPQLLAAFGHYAHSQGKFWEFHDALPRNRFPAPERAELEQIAQQVGLDLADLRAALEEDRWKAQMERDREELRAARLEGPGAFVVGGRHAESPLSLIQLVEAGMRRAGRKPPARPANVLGFITNPSDRGYEPQKLMHQMSVRQLFNHEPRDSAWAVPVEKALGPVIDRDLRAIEPGLASTTLECRQNLCRLRWRAGKGDDKVITAAARTLYPSFGRFTPGEMMLALRSATGRTPEDAIARFNSRRSAVLYNHRTGRATTKLPFPVERLPKD